MARCMALVGLALVGRTVTRMPVQDVKMSAAHYVMTQEIVVHDICDYLRSSVVRKCLNRVYILKVGKTAKACGVLEHRLQRGFEEKFCWTTSPW